MKFVFAPVFVCFSPPFFFFPVQLFLFSKHCTLYPERNSGGQVVRVMVRDTSSTGTYIDGEKIGKDNLRELTNGSELSLGFPSSSVAKKSKTHASSFVAFIFKSLEEGTAAAPHPAFLEADGPSQEYECGKELGSGAFAQVHLCIHRATKKKWAAKIIDKQKFALNKELRSGSFRDEIDILKSLQHPYIVGVKDIYETGRYLVIILQYVDGGDLFDLLVSKKRFTEDEAKIIFLQMVEGLQYLHHLNIAHRDLKPENYLVVSKQSDVHVLMADFGLARFHAGDMKTLCGTPQYLPPELVLQALGKAKGSTYTQAVDVWSLGVVLYVMLSGYPPFGPKDHKLIMEAKYDFNHARWKTVSQTAKDLISAMLAKDPQKRLTIDQVRQHPWLVGVEVPPLPQDAASVEPTPNKNETPSITTTTTTTRPSSDVRQEQPAAAGSSSSTKKAVQFEVPEKERAPTDLGVDKKKKLKGRAPTGMPKKRDRVEEDDEDDDKEEEEGGLVAMDVAKSSPAALSEEALAALKVAELRAMCSERGLSAAGTKSVLMQRLLGE